MVELVRAGRTPAELAREFGVTAQSIANWVAQAAVDSGKPLPRQGWPEQRRARGTGAPATREPQLKMERDILAKATAWFAGKGDKTSTASSNS